MDPTEIPCPTCSAPIGVRCRVPRGRVAKEPHLARRQLAGCDIPQTGRPPTLISVPCPVCSAGIGERCVTETGKVHCSGHDARRADAGLTARRIVAKARANARMSEDEALALVLSEVATHWQG